MKTINVQSSCDDEKQMGTLTVEDALHRMLDAVTERSTTERIHLTQAIDRVLAEPLVSPINVPSHRNSAVDGYALNSAMLPIKPNITTLSVVGKIVAGHPYQSTLKQDKAVQIMTGAQMPEGADTVIMQEHVETEQDSVRFDARHTSGQNVRQAGEDIKQGQTILKTGIKLTPPQIGLIASLGIAEVNVKTAITAAVFSTGDEILSLGQPPREGCIYDSNRYSIISALKKLGCRVVDLGIISDDPVKLKETFELASNSADVIFTSGGVSVGEADFTKQVLADVGNINFWKVAMKPGRPVAFGHVNGTTFFGLPGNPVAVMVTFYQFALPCLQKIMGIKNPLITPSLQAQSTQNIRKLPGRTEIQRGILSQTEAGEWQVCTSGKQGSGILRSMSDANAFIILEHERASVSAGEQVTVQPFSGLF